MVKQYAEKKVNLPVHNRMYVTELTLSPTLSIGQDPIVLRKTLLEKSMQTLQSQNFLRDLDELSGLVHQIDPPSSTLLDHLDQKAADLGTYYFAAFCGTHDVGVALSAYKTVRSLVRYIFLADRYFEIGNVEYGNLAKGVLKALKDDSGSFLKSTITYSLKKIWPFWKFEHSLRRRMLRGDGFDRREVRQFNFLKSSDTELYSAVLEAFLPDYDYNIGSVLHYNQALQDLKDDFEDIAEDIHDSMPNAFVLASALRRDVKQTLAMAPSQARDRVLDSGAATDIMYIAQGYYRSVNVIELPKPYRFLKLLSKEYFTLLERSLTPYLN